MVRAILDGRKTQTRRVIKPHPNADNWTGRCPYGKSGDQLWVRERYTLTNHGDPVYFADFKDKRGDYWHSIAVDPKGVKWKPSIYMPRSASRITLEITGVSGAWLQDISRGDAMAEGCPFANTADGPNPRQWYADLWEQINGEGSWDANPWVWVIEFKRVKP